MSSPIRSSRFAIIGHGCNNSLLACITAPLNEEANSMELDHITKSPRLHVPENGKSTRYSLERICAHEVLQDCEPNSPIGSNNKLKRKVVYCFGPVICLLYLVGICKVNKHN